MTKRALHLFEGYGIEMEYMIVREDNLDVLPICDLVLEKAAGEIINEVEMGKLSWSNELVLHVIELKTNGPVQNISALDKTFLNGVQHVNSLLKPLGGVLLPGAMHPFMKETKIWPHENNVIYDSYNRIFDCSGPGWSNLQSVHINLPFQGDEEFGKLHAAIRLVLPLLPAIAASSPVMDEKITGLKDSRLEVYRNNQKKIPEIAGLVIPEPVFTALDYENEILQKTYRAIAPFDPEGILQEEWLNSRGAIARFERNTIEIRLLDIQESPVADIAVVSVIIALIQALTDGMFLDYHCQKQFATEKLADVFVNTIRNGEDTVITDTDYLGIFGVKKSCTAGELWSIILEKLLPHSQELREYEPVLNFILQHGTLSTRIVKALDNDLSRTNVIRVYRLLSECLEKGELFLP